MEPEHRARIAELEQKCRQRGVYLTIHRRTLLEVLLRRDDHPTADQIWDAVRQTHPEFSRRSVYRVLDKLAELGLIRRVHHPGAAVRYDAKIQRHHHLVCVHCNRITDFESACLDRIGLPEGTPRGYEISDFSVQLIGVCPACRGLRQSDTSNPPGTAKEKPSHD